MLNKHWEPHVTPKVIAELWQWSEETVIRTFEKEPGVLVLGADEADTRRRRKLSIPASVVERVHRRLSVPG